jgi:hypothetical protein
MSEQGLVVPLTQGQYAIVSPCDFERVSQFKWRALWESHTKSFYAARTERIGGKRRMVRMHRFIMNAPDGTDIDHWNHNTLDNRRHNLRCVPHRQNQENQQKQAGCSSKFKGVSWHKRDRKWMVYIYDGEVQANGERAKRHLGYFDSEIEAALAYDAAARVSFGATAALNFPELHEQGCIKNSCAPRADMAISPP